MTDFIFDSVDSDCYAAKYHGGDRAQAIRAIRANWESLVPTKKRRIKREYTSLYNEAFYITRPARKTNIYIELKSALAKYATLRAEQVEGYRLAHLGGYAVPYELLLAADDAFDSVSRSTVSAWPKLSAQQKAAIKRMYPEVASAVRADVS